ncbi:WD40 repeat domain-containing protein [Geitlerinema sp. PCC 7407]|uniref:WD40 repeat domain-containing protein n=1 Tax=Geitlerinema sp. PCC 7407 TaxID=1173025 RepID=UPI00029FE817|nr:WD40 repeat domain-containing protein [Geitlerinema sp. PCC 7407]AFY65719.1 peptidase domain protein [Geitlerinema sp. PCC 7407]
MSLADLGVTQAFFNEAYYLAQNPDVQSAVSSGAFQSGYQHFLAFGVREGRNPSAGFDAAYYLLRNPDVAQAVQMGSFEGPFAHFALFGVEEGRSPAPELEGTNLSQVFEGGWVDRSYRNLVLLRQLDSLVGEVGTSVTVPTAPEPAPVLVAAPVPQETGAAAVPPPPPLAQFAESTLRQFFDEGSYLAANGDVAAAVQSGTFQNGLQHFLLFGAREGRDPGPAFDNAYYLARNPDVAAAIRQKAFESPLEHFLLFGRFEGRSPLPPLTNPGTTAPVEPVVPPISGPTPVPSSLGALAGTRTLRESVGDSAPQDAYQFTLASASKVSLVLDGLSANARVQILNGSGAVVATSDQPGSLAEGINQRLGAGAYQVLVSQAAAGQNTGYNLVISGVAETTGALTNLEVTTATYLGTAGTDSASAVEISPNREIIVAGNFNGVAQLQRLSLSGQQVLATVPLGGTMNDMDLNRSNGQIVAAGSLGVKIYDDRANTLVRSLAIGAVDRVAVANNGNFATLSDRTITLWSAAGQAIAQTTLASRTDIADIAISLNGTQVYATGYTQKSADLQVPFVTAFDASLKPLWNQWDYGATTALNGGKAADSRGVRISIGQDGGLYFLGRTDGGNSVFTWNGSSTSALGSGQLIQTDAYNTPYNLPGAITMIYYARLDPLSGAVVKSQFALTRKGSGEGNSFGGDSITADTAGNVYIGGYAYATIANRDSTAIAGQTVGSYSANEPAVLSVSADFSTRRYWNTFNESGASGTVNGFAVGYGRAAAFGTVKTGAVITTASAPNPSALGGQDAFLATWSTL